MQLFVYKNNQQLGPFDENGVLDQLRSGQLSPDDLGIREGETNWTRLGDIFAGRLQLNEPPASAFTLPIQGGGQVFAAPAAAPRSGGGCRKAAGWTILIVGLLMFLGGAAIAVATPFAYSMLTCDIADKEWAKVEELKKKYDAAKGTPEEYAAGVELKQQLDSAAIWNEGCAEQKATRRWYQIGSIAVAVVGFFMMIIGFFIRRVRRA